MIKNKDSAIEISALMLDISERLNGSIRMVQDTCDEEDLKIYRRAAGKVLGEILLEVLNPLYVEHPSLKPAGLD